MSASSRTISRTVTSPDRALCARASSASSASWMSSRLSIVRLSLAARPPSTNDATRLNSGSTRNRQRDLVSHAAASALPRSPARAGRRHPDRPRLPDASRSAREATQHRGTRPEDRPVSFCTGREIAKLSVRTAWSAATTASTALSVAGSSLSSCAFTRSTVPPSLVATGNRSRSVPRSSDESRSNVSARRRSAHAPARPTATRKTASPTYAASPAEKATTRGD